MSGGRGFTGDQIEGGHGHADAFRQAWHGMVER